MAGPTKRKSRASVERGVIDYIQRPTADAGTGVILMGPYNPYGVLDRQLSEYLGGEGERVIAKIPKAVALAQAAAGGCSVAELRNGRHAAEAFSRLADGIEAALDGDNI